MPKTFLPHCLEKAKRRLTRKWKCCGSTSSLLVMYLSSMLTDRRLCIMKQPTTWLLSMTQAVTTCAPRVCRMVWWLVFKPITVPSLTNCGDGQSDIWLIRRTHPGTDISVGNAQETASRLAIVMHQMESCILPQLSSLLLRDGTNRNMPRRLMIYLRNVCRRQARVGYSISTTGITIW